MHNLVNLKAWNTLFKKGFSLACSVAFFLLKECDISDRLKTTQMRALQVKCAREFRLEILVPENLLAAQIIGMN